MADNLKVKYKGEVYSVSTNMLLSANEIEEFMDMIHHCFEKIHSTTEIRVIVLETWMMIEYYIRLALSYVYHIQKYKTDDIDPKYDLLFNSFNVCIEKFKLVLESQRKLPKPPKEKDSISGGAILLYIRDKYPDTWAKLREIEEEYNKKDEPKDLTTININDYMTTRGPYQDARFVDSFANIDEEWFRKANKFNNTRNCAAHNYREEKIYHALGFSGERSFELSKQYCIDMLKDLCSFERISAEESVDFDLDS